MTFKSSDDGGRAGREGVAGIVDLFDALTRSELRRALSELAFKRGMEIDDEAIRETINRSIREYALVSVGDETDESDADAADDGDLLLVGPTAFPVLPPNAEDLPYILDVPDREIDRDRAGKHVRRRLTEEVEAAIEDDESARLAILLEVTYDLESWAPVEIDDLRDRIEEAIDDAEADDDADTDD
ncbi:hypothetical protein ACERIT_10945 [Halopenitus sp. H-Gu1]|uniref:DUF7109 family protein n=1 Tax=Halopenitus sp. H-Gu1 TaxID=3242697 RepID=UPI00359D3DF8